VLLKLNAYDFPEAATRFGLFGIPAFLFFHEGRLLGKMSEYKGARFFTSVVREQLDKVKALAAAEG
jgi:thioredoxin-like negative regulator of GroEL